MTQSPTLPEYPSTSEALRSCDPRGLAILLGEPLPSMGEPAIELPAWLNESEG